MPEKKPTNFESRLVSDVLLAQLHLLPFALMLRLALSRGDSRSISLLFLRVEPGVGTLFGGCGDGRLRAVCLGGGVWHAALTWLQIRHW